MKRTCMRVDSQGREAEARQTQFNVGFTKQAGEGNRKREAIAWMNQEFLEGYAFEMYLDIN